MAKKAIYKSLYFQVIVAIIIGVLLGHFYPETGAAMKPLGDGFIKLVLFAIISLFALREFITLAPTRSGDYYALLAAFYIVLPWQYYLVWIDWYGMYTLLIPVYAFLFLPPPSGRHSMTQTWCRTPASW